MPDESAYNKKLEITQNYLNSSMKVLEFGCGTGSTALVHAPHVDSLLAIDISGEMIRIARKKVQDAGIKNLVFEKTSFDSFQAASGAYDAILGLSILHLLDDWQGAIEKVGRLLKPGGIFVSNTACLGDDLKIFKYIAPIGRVLGLLPMLRVFTRSQLTACLEHNGFAIEYKWSPGKYKGVFIVARKVE